MNLIILQVYWEKGWISFIISSFSFLYLLNFTWLKWGDLIIDAGREMYVPLELVSGRLLYRDIFYLYGPFSPYFNAFLFKLFGVHIHTLILSGVITVCVVSILIYKISRFFLNVFFSTFIVLTFLFVFAFGHYVYLGNYNFIVPYSYPAIHGIMFSLIAVYFCFLSLFKRNAKYKFFYGVSSVLTFLCRVELGVMLILSIFISLSIYFISRRETFRKIISSLFVYLVLPTSYAIFAYSLFFIPYSGILNRSGFFDIWFNSSFNINNSFTAWLLGVSNISANISAMLKSFLYYILFCVYFGGGGLVLEYIWKPRQLRLSVRILFLVLIGVFYMWTGIIFFRKLFGTYDMQYRSLPIISLLIIFISIWRLIRYKGAIKDLFIIIISFYSFFLMSRILFHVWAGHYGFYLLVPALVIYHIFFINIVGEILHPGLVRNFFRFGFIFLCILFIISHFNISRFCYGERTLKISSQRGALYVFNGDRENRLKELLDYLARYTDKDESLVVFPEGPALNFFSERKNPLYSYSMDFIKKDVINEIISGMERYKMGYVVLKTDEQGYAIFGKDYGREILEYVLENYSLFKQFGPSPYTNKGYKIMLYKRKV